MRAILRLHACEQPHRAPTAPAAALRPAEQAPPRLATASPRLLALHALSTPWRRRSRSVRCARSLRAAHRSCLCAHACCAHATRPRQTLIKFFGFSAAILVVPVLMQYRGLEGKQTLLCRALCAASRGVHPQRSSDRKRSRSDAVAPCSAALEAVMGAPLVRNAENRVYASAALSFGTCVTVRAPCHACLRSHVLRSDAGSRCAVCCQLVIAFIISALLEARPAAPAKKAE